MVEKRAAASAADMLLAAQLNMHLANRLPAVLGSLAAAFIVALIMRPRVGDAHAAGWLAVMVIVLLIRLGIASIHVARGAEDVAAAERWLDWHHLCAGLHGAAWGLAAILVYPADDPALKSFLVLVLVGVSASGSVLVALDLWAVLLFVVPLLLPLAARIFLDGGAIDLAIAALIIAYGIFVMIVARMAQDRQVEHLVMRARESERAARLQRSEELLARTSEIARVGGWELERDGTPRLTPQTLRIHGFQDGARPRTLLNHYASSDRDALKEAAKRAFEEAVPFILELPCVTADGRAIWVRVAGQPELENGVVVRLRGVTQDITDRKVAELDLRESAGQMRIVVDSVAEAIVIVDTSCRIRMANRAVEQLFGHAQDWLIGRDIRTLLFAGDVAARESADLCAPSDKRRHRQVLSRNRDGKAVALELATARVTWHREVSSVWVLRDITAQKQLEESLQAAARSADQANRAKSHFLANMSHEIRTPLNGMLGMIELLSTLSLTGEQQDYVVALRRSSRLLLSVLNDVLDLSKIESGQFELEVRVFDLHRTLQACMELARPVAMQKGLRLDLTIHPKTPSHVRGDPTRLQQVLNNLISNAVKFTATGGASVRAEPVYGNIDAVRFTVSDTGQGIDLERQRTLFQPFVQADSSTTRRYGGTGLGLVIARRIVDAMGGTILLSSVPGSGSTFTFTARLAQVVGEFAVESDSLFGGLPRSNSGENGRPGTGLHILLVEDNEVNRLYAEATLNKLGCGVDSAESGEAAVQAVQAKGPYDLILMDLQMPGIDGVEATTRIRAYEQQSGIGTQRVVAVTASALPEDRQRCLACGMSGVLSKPYTIDEMRALLAGS